MTEIEIYRRQSFGQSVGVGRKAALLVVDFTVGFNDPSLFGGGNIDAAIKATVPLLGYFREAGLPVAFTRVVYAEDGSNAGVFTIKVPGLRVLTESHPAGQIVPQLLPRDGELLVRKTEASAFFGTGLAPWLVWHRCDTVIVTGCTTSGCVRASVVDAVSHNFRTIVASECVGDRALGPHDANLFDMAQKYADVLGRDEIVTQLRATARA